LEALALLAAQASGSLANARRYEEGRAYEELMAYQATHDGLTGLPNRTLLMDRASALLARSRRGGSLVAVIFLDLDRFKEINDSLGHAIGDALLQQVGARIVEHLRPEDTCARLGGDEFVVLAGDQPHERAVLDLAHRIGAALHRPFHIEEVSLDIEASLGVAWSPMHGDDVDTLLRRADGAMYAAKTRREGVVVCDEEDARAPTHLSTLGDLRRALDSQDQLLAHFQPIVGIASGRPAGVEALLRWDHPSRGRVMPGDFISVAEGTAVIHGLTDHVVGLAFTSLKEWLAQGIDLEMSVNLSTRTLLDTSLSRRMETLLDHHGIDASRIRLEITESALLADPTRAIATMHRLTELGFRLSIDDFGTGYSSMSYLKSLPVDEIKIDRSFVTDMRRSARDYAVVRSVIDLGHSMGLQVVAEGIEDEATFQELAVLGCDLAQGYHLGRPMSSAALVTWTGDWSRRDTPPPGRAEPAA
jgi:diguanylate cyclase (GGDEF)-like protein